MKTSLTTNELLKKYFVVFKVLIITLLILILIVPLEMIKTLVCEREKNKSKSLF